jgi:hypothetical protein
MPGTELWLNASSLKDAFGSLARRISIGRAFPGTVTRTLVSQNRMAATACASELRDRVSGPKVGFVKAGHKVGGSNEVADGEV